MDQNAFILPNPERDRQGCRREYCPAFRISRLKYDSDAGHIEAQNAILKSDCELHENVGATDLVDDHMCGPDVLRDETLERLTNGLFGF